ncbi:hypothetical protein DPMN_066728 [Dreissena polymorpha]|uniref:Uncharacterized protein n=1 Tax=Dreissena polymorpha TaxID=45954 RepID=A0A9D4BT39_DREPO|nr:hypothetical protein DPMN_066728 [Dreissena polymorpha]
MSDDPSDVCLHRQHVLLAPSKILVLTPHACLLTLLTQLPTAASMSDAQSDVCHHDNMHV